MLILNSFFEMYDYLNKLFPHSKLLETFIKTYYFCTMLIFLDQGYTFYKFEGWEQFKRRNKNYYFLYTTFDKDALNYSN